LRELALGRPLPERVGAPVAAAMLRTVNDREVAEEAVRLELIVLTVGAGVSGDLDMISVQASSCSSFSSLQFLLILIQILMLFLIPCVDVLPQSLFDINLNY
jgi:hypothetical protein